MYAVVKTGGKQYRVAKDDKILVERIEGEAGASIQLDNVMMLVDGEKFKSGHPLLKAHLSRLKLSNRHVALRSLSSAVSVVRITVVHKVIVRTSHC